MPRFCKIRDFIITTSGENERINLVKIEQGNVKQIALCNSKLPILNLRGLTLTSTREEKVMLAGGYKTRIVNECEDQGENFSKVYEGVLDIENNDIQCV